MKRRLLLFVTWLLAGAAAAAPPQRIVSLVPGLTESLCALGACARLVGTDRYSNWPPEVQALPKLGGLDDAQVERIAALKPDLVLAAPSARATQAWTAIEAQMAAAAARVPPAQRGRSVYFEVEASPYAAGPTSFIGQTLQRLGLHNIVPAELGPFPKLSPEFVVRARPQIVIAEVRNVRDMAGRPGWGALPALQQRQVCAFAAERYDVLVRPGPRMGEAALQLADCLAGLDKEPR